MRLAVDALSPEMIASRLRGRRCGEQGRGSMMEDLHDRIVIGAGPAERREA
ncbi:MAG TPA: hypothetical protein VIM99_10310 [Blastocatellia bacterium]